MAADLSPAPAPAPAPPGPRRRRHPVRWAMAAVAALVVLPGVVVLGSRLGEDTNAGFAVMDRPAPSFALETLDGGTITSDELAGRPYVVNFWASWCPPCWQEHPHLEAFYGAYQPRGVELLGVIFGDTPANARAYQAEVGGDWPLLIDPKGRTALDFGVRGPPETFIVDAGGTIVLKITGPVGPGSLESIFAQLGVAPAGG